MKKFMSLVLAGVAVFALSGCGGGGDGEESPVNSVNIADLEDGYGIDFLDDDEGGAYISFCNGEYTVWDGQVKEDSGDAVVDGTTLELVSDGGGIISIETAGPTPNVLQVGRIYEVTEDEGNFNVEVDWMNTIPCA